MGHRRLPLPGPREVRRAVVLVVGGTILLLGLALLVLPGPGLLVILLGLGVLGAEYTWARRILQEVKRRGERLRPRRD